MIIGVRFSPSGKVHYYDGGGIRVSFGDKVLVETERGEIEASVVIGSGQTVRSDIEGELPRVLRLIERAPEIP